MGNVVVMLPFELDLAVIRAEKMKKREEKHWATNDHHFVHLATLGFWGVCPCPTLQVYNYYEHSMLLVMILSSWLQMNDPNWTNRTFPSIYGLVTQ